jgi:hypothetical protein
MAPPRIRFAPVQLNARHDGWTAARQLRFIEVLDATKSIAEACKAVGMSRASAYKLRDRPEPRNSASPGTLRFGPTSTGRADALRRRN